MILGNFVLDKNQSTESADENDLLLAYGCRADNLSLPACPISLKYMLNVEQAILRKLILVYL